MFDSLLGSKFSIKCKHAIKCIGSRLGPIRNKKNAMLKFLKQDVADLLCHGHHDNALGRMDALIVEINRMSCYDMIEDCCQFILQLLSDLQKQRECPQDAMEAVSTLIYAAARFPDLPELCDLRRVFTERYGSPMDLTVNKEFVEKIQKKSFPVEQKLHVMQEIAKENSVDWDFKNFETKIDPSHLAQSDKLKKASVSNKNNELLHNAPNHDATGSSERVPFKGRDECIPRDKARDECIPRDTMQKKDLHKEPKDIHMVPNSFESRSHDSSRRVKKIFAEEVENIKPSLDDTNYLPYVTSKDELKEIHDAKVDDIDGSITKWTKDNHPPSIKSKDGLNSIHKAEVHKNDSSIFKGTKDNHHPYVKSKVGLNSTNEAKVDEVGDSISKRTEDNQKGDGQHKYFNGSVESGNGKVAYRIPPYTKPREPMNAKHVKEQKDEGMACQSITVVVEGLDSVNEETQSVRLMNSYKDRENDTIPSYSKHKVLRYSRLEELDSIVEERQTVRGFDSYKDKATDMIPPYVKLKSCDKPSAVELFMLSDPSIQISTGNAKLNVGTGLNGDLGSYAEKPRPRSVRKQDTRVPVLNDVDAADESASTMAPSNHRRPGSTQRNSDHIRYREEMILYTKAPSHDDEVNAINYGNLLNRTPKDGRRQQRGGASAAKYDAVGDEEEAIDKLLDYYSKKDRTSTASERKLAIPLRNLDGVHLVLDHSRNKEHNSGYEHSRLLHGRAISLPPEPVSPPDATEGPHRAASMQPDLFSPKIGRVHPKLPDYDELAGRISALRQTYA